MNNNDNNQKANQPKAFGYAAIINGTCTYITPTIEEAMAEACDYLAGGDQVRIEACDTPMDWLQREATFEGKADAYTNDAIIAVAERIKEARRNGTNTWER